MSTAHKTHKIGLTTATIICMNAMIGAGIFVTPAKLATSVGPAGLLSYAFVIVAVLCMALGIARVAQLYPQEGSFYAYAKQWGGHLAGVIAAGCYIIGVVIALGLLTKMAVSYIHELVPSVPQTLLGVLIIGSIVLLNIIGVKVVQAGQIFLIGCTLFSIIITSIVCLLHANTANLVPFMPQGFSSVVSATKTALFAFLGFESAASLFSIVKKPHVTVPRALILSISIVGLLYIVFISSIILGIPRSLFTSADMPLSDAIAHAFGSYKWLAQLIGISIITALLGVLQSMMYSLSMLTLSFCKLLHSSWAKQFAATRSSFPLTVGAIGAWTLVNFLCLNNMDLFFSLTAIFVVGAFIMTLITLLFQTQKQTSIQYIITYSSLTTASILFISALRDLVHQIMLI